MHKPRDCVEDCLIITQIPPRRRSYGSSTTPEAWGFNLPFVNLTTTLQPRCFPTIYKRRNGFTTLDTSRSSSLTSDAVSFDFVRSSPFPPGRSRLLTCSKCRSSNIPSDPRPYTRDLGHVEVTEPFRRSLPPQEAGPSGYQSTPVPPVRIACVPQSPFPC